MTTEASVGVTFHSPRWGCCAFPEVALRMEGTCLCIATEVTNKYARTTMPIARIKEALDGLLGPFVWSDEIDHAMRLTQIYGRREMARMEAMLGEVTAETRSDRDLPHGWRSSGQWGLYGLYGWHFGLYHSACIVADGLVESYLTLAVGPFRANWDKLETSTTHSFHDRLTWNKGDAARL